jgi:hypothetical protein
LYFDRILSMSRFCPECYIDSRYLETERRKTNLI